MDERIEEADSRIQEVEQEVFASFCEKIGIKNVREYEERQLKMTNEIAEKRMQFETQKAKLENQYVLMFPVDAYARSLCYKFTDSTLRRAKRRVPWSGYRSLTPLLQPIRRIFRSLTQRRKG